MRATVTHCCQDFSVRGVVARYADLNTSRGRRCHGSFSRAALQSEYSTDYSCLSPLHLLHVSSSVTYEIHSLSINGGNCYTDKPNGILSTSAFHIVIGCTMNSIVLLRCSNCREWCQELSSCTEVEDLMPTRPTVPTRDCRLLLV